LESGLSGGGIYDTPTSGDVLPALSSSIFSAEGLAFRSSRPAYNGAFSCKLGHQISKNRLRFFTLNTAAVFRNEFYLITTALVFPVAWSRSNKCEYFMVVTSTTE
jgi:hypothetical protein